MRRWDITAKIIMRKLFTLLSAVCCICVMFAAEPMPVANAGFQKMLRRTAAVASRKTSVHKATNEILSGSCGTNLTWSLDTSTGVLTITGSGAMTDFEDLYDDSGNWIGCSIPWYDYVTSITSVSLPSGLTTIGQIAFSDCTALTTISIPNGVTSIGGYAFYGCTALTSITLPNSITSIGEGAFYTSGINTPVYNNTVFAYLPASYSGEYALPNGITTIAGGAFADCTSLTAVEIPNSVTNIGAYAFSGSTNLRYILMSSAIPPTLGEGALHLAWYNGYPIIVYVVVPCGSKDAYISEPSWADYVNYIYDESVFYDVNVISSNTSQGTVEFTNDCDSIYMQATPKANYVFYKWSDGSKENPRAIELTQDTSIIAYFSWGESGTCGDNLTWKYTAIDNTLTIEGSGAMKNEVLLVYEGITWYNIPWAKHNLYINTVILPQDLTSIGSQAFYMCENLTTVIMHDKVSTIGAMAFEGCSSLTSIDIPSSVTGIGKQAFYGCSSLPIIDNLRYAGSVYLVEAADKTLTSYEIKESTRWIERDAFSGCSNMAYIEIPESITNLKNGTFSYCRSLTSVVMDSVKYIYDSVFYGCSSLQNVSIPNKLKYIGKDAFRGCNALTSVTIPNSVTSIGSSAFGGCRSLTSVTLNSDAIVRENRSTDSNINHIFGSQVKEYILGNDITGIGTNAFYGCSNLKTLSLGEDISSYGDNAFAGCSALTSITNYRKTPARLGTDAFKDVDYFNCTLHVLAGSVNMYKASGSDWKDFYYIKPIGTTETTVTEDKVTVSPADNTALFTWRMSEDASTYTLQITKDGVIFCTLSFDADGSLKGIAFVPGKDGQAHAPAATLTANGMQFTVTGLNAASKYAYRLAVADAQNNEIIAYSGEFATNGYEGEVNPGGNPEGIDEVPSDQVPNTKVLRNGQIYILRGDKTYTLQGQEVK